MESIIAATAQHASSLFDSIRKVDGYGQEYWEARKLMTILGYQKWERFGAKESTQVSVIGRAIISCRTAGNSIEDHFNWFPRQGTSTQYGLQTTPENWHLSRLACYLVAMCGDVTKPEIAAAQAYFATKTREAEELKRMSPAEIVIAQGEAMLAIEKEQVRIAAKQAQLETRLILEAQRTNELEQLVRQHEGEIDRLFHPNGHYFSVMGYARNRGLNMPAELAKSIGGKCSRYCKKNNIPIEKLNDSRWGKVGSYPENVISMFV